MPESGPTQDQRDRVRSYLLGQAESKSFPELWPAVETARSALLVEVEGFCEKQAGFKPPVSSAEGSSDSQAGWSILEVLRHVLFEEEDVWRQIAALAAGRRTEGKLIGRLAGREEASLPQVLQDLREVRAGLLSGVEALAGSENLDATAPHPWFGELNCRAWFLFQRVHDGDHTRQVQKIKSHPAFPAP